MSVDNSCRILSVLKASVAVNSAESAEGWFSPFSQVNVLLYNNFSVAIESRKISMIADKSACDGRKRTKIASYEKRWLIIRPYTYYYCSGSFYVHTYIQAETFPGKIERKRAFGYI